LLAHGSAVAAAAVAARVPAREQRHHRRLERVPAGHGSVPTPEDRRLQPSAAERVRGGHGGSPGGSRDGPGVASAAGFRGTVAGQPVEPDAGATLRPGHAGCAVWTRSAATGLRSTASGRCAELPAATPGRAVPESTAPAAAHRDDAAK